MLDGRKLVLREVIFQEYLFLKKRANFPSPRVEKHNRDGSQDGFADIDPESILTANGGCKGLFELFDVNLMRNVKWMSVFDIRSRKWRKWSWGDLDEEVFDEIDGIVSKTRGLVYVGFPVRSRDSRLTNETAFKVAEDGRAVSVYTQVPGALRFRDCTWRGSSNEFLHIHGIVSDGVY